MAEIEQCEEIAKRISDFANFIYIRQKGPYGNGTPVLCAANIVKDEPFVYVWGDDLVKAKVSFTKSMINDYYQHGHLMIGVQKVPRQVVNRYGIVKLHFRIHGNRRHYRKTINQESSLSVG